MSLSPIEERILSICQTRTLRRDLFKALREQWSVEYIHRVILHLEVLGLLEEDQVRRERGYVAIYLETTEAGSLEVFGRTSY